MGMQMLLERSEEGATDGPRPDPWRGAAASALEGRLQPDGSRFKVPHMGWNEVWQVRPHPLWEGIADGSRFYFVHSFYCAPRDPRHSAGETRYPDAFTSAIARDNIFATQFHPEKSAAAGLKLLSNFCHLESLADPRPPC